MMKKILWTGVRGVREALEPKCLIYDLTLFDGKLYGHVDCRRVVQ